MRHIFERNTGLWQRIDSGQEYLCFNAGLESITFYGYRDINEIFAESPKDLAEIKKLSTGETYTPDNYQTVYMCVQ